MEAPPLRVAGQIRDALSRRLDEMLDSLGRLVAIDSGSGHVAGVTAVSDQVAAPWLRLGYEDRAPLLPSFGPLRSLHKRYAGGRGKLVILGHVDTVWPAGTVSGWGFSTDGTHAFGPGVGDMKGSLVMATFALQELERLGAVPFGEVALMLVPDEELGSPGSRGWIETECQDADNVLVLEPGRPGGGIVVGRGAVGAIEARFGGRTAHVAVNFDEGVSALRAAAAAIAPLEGLSDREAGTQVSVGVLRAGVARQVIPDRADMLIDLRSADLARSDALLADVTQILRDHAAGPVTLDLRGGWTRPGFPAAVSESLYRRAETIAAHLGIAVDPVVTWGGSDGNFPAALGRPTLDGVGPICHDTCSRRERIEIRSLVDRGALFAGLIASG